MFLIFIYVSAIVLANQLVFMIGPWWSIVNSVLLIGLDFILRDKIHEKIGLRKVILLSVIAGLVSFFVNPEIGSIAIASSISFVLASIGDGVIYQSLINRKWIVKSNSSNVVASAIDSSVFPFIAFGAFMPAIMIGQFMAKVVGGIMWSLIIGKFK